MKQPTTDINGLVLCGGKSKRMGRDKSEIEYHNKTQREHVFSMLLPFCNEVFLSVNERQIQHVQHLPFIQDTVIDKGPAGGILSAFQRDANEAWLVVACDLPYLNFATIDYLVQHRNKNKMATAFWNEEGNFPEPLIAIWEPKAQAALLQFVNAGFTCPRKFLIRSDVEMITAPDASVFANINTKEEHDETLKLLHHTDELVQ